MMFLSGVFFPREQLPPLVRTLSAALPLTNAVELVRPLFMDQWPAQPAAPRAGARAHHPRRLLARARTHAAAFSGVMLFLEELLVHVKSS